MKPADADFGVTVEFRKGKSDPVRVFQGLSILLDGFQQFNSVFLGAVNSRIEPSSGSGGCRGKHDHGMGSEPLKAS